MFKLYNTEKELYYVPDYRPLPDDINTWATVDLKKLYNNIAAAYDNAFCNHAELLQAALYTDLLTVSKQIEKRRKERQ